MFKTLLPHLINSANLARPEQFGPLCKMHSAINREEEGFLSQIVLEIMSYQNLEGFLTARLLSALNTLVPLCISKLGGL